MAQENLNGNRKFIYVYIPVSVGVQNSLYSLSMSLQNNLPNIAL